MSQCSILGTDSCYTKLAMILLFGQNKVYQQQEQIDIVVEIVFQIAIFFIRMFFIVNNRVQL